MKDITYCVSSDCPFVECHRKLNKEKLKPDDVVSIADLSGVCRHYIAWLVNKCEEERR